MKTISINFMKRRLSHLNLVKCPQHNYVIYRYLSEKADENICGQKIYHGSLASQIRLVKLFSLGTSMGGVIAQPMLYEKGIQLGGTPMVVFMCSFVGFFTFVTPLMLHWITRNYVTELHYNVSKDSYTATTLTLFLRQKKVCIH